MKKKPLSLEEVEQAIGAFAPEEKKRLVKDLPKLLGITIEDLALLDAAKTSFEFWDNKNDAAYDAL